MVYLLAPAIFARPPPVPSRVAGGRPGPPLAPSTEEFMTATVIVDELHVTVRVPAGLPGPEAESVRRALDGDAFPDRLRAAVEAVVREIPELSPAAVTVSR